MALFEDDEDLDGSLGDAPKRRHPNPADSSWDEDPDERDLVPDEMTTVRCTRCRKWIIEDSIRCPYCKEIQLDDHHSRKPLWFVLIAILCIFLTVSYLLLQVIETLGIFHH